MLTADIAGALTASVMLAPADHANTAAATQGTGTDIAAYEGELVFVQHTGVVTAGTVVGSIITSASSNLADPTTVATFTSVGTSTDLDVQYARVNCSKLQQYVGYIGTIVTGPAVVGCSVLGTKKYV